MSFSPVLPVSVPLQRDVSPLGFTQQLSIANGFRDIAHFARITGIRPTMLAAGNRGELARLEKWTQADLRPLTRFVKATGSDLTSFGSAVVKSDYLQTQRTVTRVCPQCLAEDLSKPASKPQDAFIRASWSWKQIFRCPSHGAQFQSVGRIEGLGDLSAIARESLATSKADPADRYFQNRLFNAGGVPFLDELEVYVATELCSVVGQLQVSYENGRTANEIGHSFENPEIRSIGFDIAKEGQNAILGCLETYHRRTGNRTGMSDFRTVAIVRWLETKLANEAYRKVIDLFQDFAERTFPLGRGNRYIRTVKDRIVHSNKTAAAEYGLPPARIERIVRENRGFIAGTPHFNRAAMHEHILRDKSFVTVREAARTLGCDIPLVDMLARAGVIAVKPGEVIGDAFCRFVVGKDVEKFLSRFAEMIVRPEEDMEAKLMPMHSRDYTSVAVIELVLSGRVRLYAKANCPVTMSSVLVDRRELRREVKALENPLSDKVPRRHFSFHDRGDRPSAGGSPPG